MADRYHLGIDTKQLGGDIPTKSLSMFFSFSKIPNSQRRFLRATFRLDIKNCLELAFIYYWYNSEHEAGSRLFETQRFRMIDLV